MAQFCIIGKQHIWYCTIFGLQGAKDVIYHDMTQHKGKAHTPPQEMGAGGDGGWLSVIKSNQTKPHFKEFILRWSA